MTSLVLLLLLAPAAAVDSIPAQLSQAALVIAKTRPGARVELDGRPLRVDAEGRFLLAAGRDRREPLQVRVFDDTGFRAYRVDVVARQWPAEDVQGVPPATVDPPPAIAARIAREQAAVAAVRQRDDARSDFAAGFDWPLTGRISGRFGSHRRYNGKPGAPHSGLDVAAPSGTPLKAPAPGTVTFVGELYLTGGTVVVDHGHGLSSVFLHLSRIDVDVGDRLARGQTFGAVGATGRASGPHMHWGLNWFAERLDPEHAPGILAAP